MTLPGEPADPSRDPSSAPPPAVDEGEALAEQDDLHEASPVRAEMKKEPKQEESLRTIFEQVLIALICAFIFRAFVVEAFVIPTGSMATTLLGAHMRFECVDCGYEYTVNYSGQEAGGGQVIVPSYATVMVNGRPVPRVYHVRCPNCGLRQPRLLESDPANDATAPPVHPGDRILVLKYLYLLNEPSRWDVVVFKNPQWDFNKDGQLRPGSTESYQQNYIKRLIGLPGETVMLLGGDVYVSDADKTIGELRPGDFRIARKSEEAQEALWRVVYNDNYRPRGVDRVLTLPDNRVALDNSGNVLAEPTWQQPWQPASGSGWEINEVNGFRFANLDGSGTLAFNADAGREGPTGRLVPPLKLTDWLAYDITVNQREPQSGGRAVSPEDIDQWGLNFPLTGRGGTFNLFYVDDLKLSFGYERLAGDGPLDATMTKRGVAWTARLLPDRLQILRDDQLVTETEVALGSGAMVDFINADYRVRIRVNGETVLETTDEQYSPDVAALLEDYLTDPERPSIQITAAEQEASLRHVGLWRDVYYTDESYDNDFYDWASPRNFPDPENLIRLGEDEYFVLGDNPFLSGDARTWRTPLHLAYEDLRVESGRVPGRFLLGKAFFVYWPAGYRPINGVPALIPNFGDMRFIE